MNKEQAEQLIFKRRAAKLAILALQSRRYATDTEYKDAVDAVLEMVPDPIALLTGGQA